MKISISLFVYDWYFSIPGATDNMKRVIGVMHMYDDQPEMEMVVHVDPKTGKKYCVLDQKKGQSKKPKLRKAPKAFLKWEYPDGYSFCIANSFVSAIMKNYRDPAEQKSKLFPDGMTYHDQDPATLVSIFRRF